MNNDLLKNTLLLIKLDAEAVYDRVVHRKSDYIRTIILKRTKDHLKQIFKSRYYDLTIDDLKLFNQELIISLEQFYREIEELGWYLTHTEDMPATIDEKITFKFKTIKRSFENLKHYLEIQASTMPVNTDNSDEPPAIIIAK